MKVSKGQQKIAVVICRVDLITITIHNRTNIGAPENTTKEHYITLEDQTVHTTTNNNDQSKQYNRFVCK